MMQEFFRHLQPKKEKQKRQTTFIYQNPYHHHHHYLENRFCVENLSHYEAVAHTYTRRGKGYKAFNKIINYILARIYTQHGSI
jgi:hypothetical protein